MIYKCALIVEQYVSPEPNLGGRKKSLREGCISVVLVGEISIISALPDTFQHPVEGGRRKGEELGYLMDLSEVGGSYIILMS